MRSRRTEQLFDRAQRFECHQKHYPSSSSKRPRNSIPKPPPPNQLWQTDFTYLKVIGWRWFYLSTILDDFSRYVVAWKLCTSMRVEDVTDTLELALTASGCAQAHVRHRPRLLSDNGPSYIAADFADWLDRENIEHIRGAPCHPQTQGKIERWHQTLKSRVLLENYFLPGDLQNQAAEIVGPYLAAEAIAQLEARHLLNEGEFMPVAVALRRWNRPKVKP